MSETTKDLGTIDSRGSLTTDPMRSFRFRAKFQTAGTSAFNSAITSFSGGFSGIGGLNMQVQPIAYREGGYNTTVHQVPGMTSFSPVTFSRGMLYGNDSAITWMRGLFAVTSGEGLSVGDTDGVNSFRCNVTIELMDHPNANGTTNVPKVGFYLHNAWIQSLAYSDLNAGGNELMFETMTLVHEGLSIAQLTSTGAAATGSKKPLGFA